ncbi:helix-turn-helix domain-containing protein [Leptospira alstonii]|uniref:helix-turn-helix domain-containing protein n=1 Tax=Leptospira alstonii TaxID=28452 RepID=UPI00077441CA|nr:helix-turn-helix transcriptional regulator [Leptospira alstonii]
MDKEKIARLEVVLQYLKEKKGLNQGQVATTIRLTPGAITKMLKNERPITIKTVLLFEFIHNISSEWFNSGIGEMILKVKGKSQSIDLDPNQELLQRILQRKGMTRIVESLLDLSDSQLSAIKNIINNFER